MRKQTNMCTKRSSTGWCRWVPLTIAAMFLIAAADARAGDDDGWRLRVDFGFFDPGGNGITIDTGTTTVRSDLDGGGGAGVRGEYQLSRRLGVEIGFFSGASVDIDVGVSGGTSSTVVEVSSYTFLAPGLDVHLTPDAKVDLYIGPQLAWVNYSDVEVGVLPGSVGTGVSVDTDLGFGGILGLDVPVGERKRWTFQMNLRYLDTKMEGDATTPRLEADFDLTIFSLGFGYRF